MYEQKRKQNVVKNVFGIAVALVVCLSLSLGKFPQGNNRNSATSDGATVLPSMQHIDHRTHASSLQQEAKPDAGSAKESIGTPISVPNLPDFTYPAKIATEAVVHIKASQNSRVVQQSFTSPLEQLFKDFFGEGFSVNPRSYKQPAQVGFGSGVIYNAEGYIITNHHVVADADHIDVTLHDNRYYVARLIGSDPTTDLALLKIDADKLSPLPLGNSDTLKVGEWVLAVGNPFNLNSTVTKGIVSAKSRHLGQQEDGKLSIQSFIQTDAVINQGNSGGALVNLQGELIGINTAIYASRSAAFMGYGFAIPSSLVKKVANDLIQYGMVQRVLLGLTIEDVRPELTKEHKLKTITGVYIRDVQEKSPCAKILQKGDIITQINERTISKCTELQEIIGCSQPGDKVTITICRNGKSKTLNVTLEKIPDAIQVVQKGKHLIIEGATFEALSVDAKKTLNLSVGVLIKEVGKGKFQAAGLKKGSILLSFDKRPIGGLQELAELARQTKGAVLIEVLEPTKKLVSYLAVDFGQHHTRHGQAK